MALPANLVFEVRTTGAATNGGAFVTGATGTDFSQQNSPQFSGVNLASTNGTSATPGVSSSSHNFVASDVGNLIQVSAGTNWTAGVYQIVSVAANVATLDRACGSAASLSSGTWAEGGALDTLGKACGFAVNGNCFWQQQGTYTITSASSNVAAGCATLPSSTGTNQVFLRGYDVTRGDSTANRTITIADGVITTFTLITAGTNNFIGNIQVDGNSRTSSRGIRASGVVWNVIAKNCTNAGVNASSANNQMIDCFVTGCATLAAVDTISVFGSRITANAITGYQTGAGSIICDTIIDNNSGGSSDGITTSGVGWYARNVTVYNNGRDNIRGIISGGAFTVHNSLSYLGVANSLNLTAANTCPVLINVASDQVAANFGAASKINQVTLSADPFTAKSTNDFSLNNTAGGGASCRNASDLGVFFGFTNTAGHADLGAVQHGDPTQPAANVVLTGTSYNDGATSGTLTLAAADVVLTGITFGIGGTSVSGSLTLPTASHLLSGDTVGRGGTSVAGSLTLPTASHVLNDQTYGIGGNGSTGSLTLPTNSHVLSDQTYGIAGNGSTGTATLPTQSQVLNGITFGIAGGSTGNVTQPATTDVRTGTQYGASGTQFTGTLDVSGGTTTGNSVVMMV